MICELISVGTELLLGDILNTNAQFLSKALAELGISVFRQTTVGDNPDRLLAAYESAFETADLIITTGGLGPTADDLTKEMAAKYFGKKMVMDEKSLEELKGHFSKLGSKMTENNVKQAEMPEGSIILKNNNGTAPGCIVSDKGKTIILLPGPPFEAEPMFYESVKPYLQKLQDCVLVSKTLKMSGIGESAMEDKILDIIKRQSNPTIAPYAGMGEVKLRITARSQNENDANALIKPVAEELYGRLSEYIYGEDDTTLEDAVIAILKSKSLTISCAESCSGGLVAGRLVNVPGVSAVFKEGAVTYSNEAKMHRLGVKAETLDKYGAVSPETAMEMAKGIAETSNTDIGLSVTGVAGPEGGTALKPVGLVYYGLYIKGSTMFKESRLSGTRQRIRTRVVTQALDFLWRNIRS